MLHKLKKSNQGFTIIEVLIVLAIAGLILLVVFLAVPALQRNSRNTQRKNDVSAVLGGVNDFITNNNGTAPTLSCGSANPYSFVTGTCASPTGVKSEYKMGYYTVAPTVTATVGQNPLTTDVVVVVVGGKCDTTTPGKTIAGSARQVAVQYMYEPSSTLTATCVDS